MRRRILKLLYRSLDADLGGRDRARLEAALGGSEELRRAKAEILRIRGAAADSAARSFKPGFADKVLAGVRSDRKAQADEAVFEFFQELFKPIAVAVSILLVLLVVYSVTRGDLIPRGEVYYASDITMNKVLELSSF
jgi:hypothetical protein